MKPNEQILGLTIGLTALVLAVSFGLAFTVGEETPEKSRAATENEPQDGRRSDRRRRGPARAGLNPSGPAGRTGRSGHERNPGVPEPAAGSGTPAPGAPEPATPTISAGDDRGAHEAALVTPAASPQPSYSYVDDDDDDVDEYEDGSGEADHEDDSDSGDDD